MLDSHEHKHAVHEFDGIIENRASSPPVYFTLLFYGLIIWGVLFMGWYLFSGWSSHGEFEEKMAAHTGKPAVEKPAMDKVEVSTPVKAEDASPAASVDASALYAEKCAGCHGASGEGAFGPDLTAGSYKYGRDRDMVVESIAKGRPKSMPAFSSSLSKAEIDALTSYILDL